MALFLSLLQDQTLLKNPPKGSCRGPWARLGRWGVIGTCVLPDSTMQCKLTKSPL